MKEELTTRMHFEFLGEEISEFDLSIMSVYGAIQRGLTKEEALKSNGVTEEDYDANVERVLS